MPGSGWRRGRRLLAAVVLAGAGCSAVRPVELGRRVRHAVAPPPPPVVQTLPAPPAPELSDPTAAGSHPPCID